jgi:hypothetical protein
MSGGVGLILTAFALAASAGFHVHRKRYGWATFHGLLCLGCYIVAAQ